MATRIGGYANFFQTAMSAHQLQIGNIFMCMCTPVSANAIMEELWLLMMVSHFTAPCAQINRAVTCVHEDQMMLSKLSGILHTAMTVWLCVSVCECVCVCVCVSVCVSAGERKRVSAVRRGYEDRFYSFKKSIDHYVMISGDIMAVVTNKSIF